MNLISVKIYNMIFSGSGVMPGIELKQACGENYYFKIKYE